MVMPLESVLAQERSHFLAIIETLRSIETPTTLIEICEGLRAGFAPGSQVRYAWANVAPELLRELWGVIDKIGGTIPDRPAAIKSKPSVDEAYIQDVLQAIADVVRWCEGKQTPELLKEIKVGVATSDNSVRLVGDVWHLNYGTEKGTYPKKGNQCIEWLAKMLAAPNHFFSVADLRGDPDGKLAGDGHLMGELETDLEGVKAIEKRLEEIDFLRATTGGTETLEDEKADLLRRLKAADSFKQITNSLRKAHHNIATQIRKLMRNKLAKDTPQFAAHLKATLKLDTPHLGYCPPTGTPVWKI